MPKSAIATEIHETLDVHGNLATKVTLDLDVLVNPLTNSRHFGFREIFGAGVEINIRTGEDCLRRRATYAIDVGQSNLNSLIFR